ncbi:pXO1-130 like-protein; C-terminal of zinc-binding protein AdcA [Actinobaculum suis]|uniref:PXO1-130 like-protein C-terminal of zinc-binding protein AdcA n=1 Tax=Actinobaculum suis TaxID=1657 RepID=A0A7Z8Y8V3_9ACTO|nr:ZinT/AdcA family metal-binding protein [Actinobaculum suis]VDG76358.1 pXO1-130 like-protein; C-terminal of zinc-binding protein AdcA [Actinobaculum suis]
MSKHIRFAAVGAALALALVGCSNDNGGSDATTSAAAPTTTAEAPADPTTSAAPQEGAIETDKKATLADWEGTWESTSGYFDNPEIQAEMEEHAKEEGETVEQVKAELDERNGTAFDAIKIDDKTITFIADLDKADNPTEQGYEYTHETAYDVSSSEHSFAWHFFKGAEGAPHKYVALMPQHGEEKLVHFHMRYGDSIDEVLKKDDWFPVMIKKGTADIEMVKEEIFEHHH